MKKRTLLILTVAALGLVFLFGIVYAAQQAADTMTMNSKVYPKHTKTLVTFSHKKHNADYKIGCTDCHHVYEGGKNVWTEGKEVKKCEACHSEPKAPRPKEGEPKLSKQETIKRFHYSAIHENCKGCHADLKKAGKPTGPVKCTECHPKPAAK